MVFQPEGTAFEAIDGIRLSSGQLIAFNYHITNPRGFGSGYANGTAASMIPIYAGLIRDSELAGGLIEHAGKIFAAPQLLEPRAVYPALAFDRGAMTIELPPYSGTLPNGLNAWLFLGALISGFLESEKHSWARHCQSRSSIRFHRDRSRWRNRYCDRYGTRIQARDVDALIRPRHQGDIRKPPNGAK